MKINKIMNIKITKLNDEKIATIERLKNDRYGNPRYKVDVYNLNDIEKYGYSCNYISFTLQSFDVNNSKETLIYHINKAIELNNKKYNSEYKKIEL